LLAVAQGARPAGRALEEAGPEPGVALPPPAAVILMWLEEAPDMVVVGPLPLAVRLLALVLPTTVVIRLVADRLLGGCLADQADQGG